MSVKLNCGALIHCTATNRYLFLLRTGGRYSNCWGLVGGKVEAGETVLEGLQREIREELGGEIKGAEYVPIEKYISDNNRFVYHTFVVNVEEEFVPVLNAEHKGWCWVELDDYPRPLHPGIYRTFNFKDNRTRIKALEELF